jgi:NAD(P)H dehydrogenase (quinone)
LLPPAYQLGSFRALTCINCSKNDQFDTAQRHLCPVRQNGRKWEKAVKHAVIFAHPSARSFTGSVANTYADAVVALGQQVVIRDLYRMNFDPRLTEEELPFTNNARPRPDVIAERQLLADADAFALIYPFWLNAPPAMLKGYLDRVFGYGFAYGRNGRSEPLLKGRFLITFSSSGAPLHWVRETGAFEAVGKLFDIYFAELCGLSFLGHTHFGAIVPMIREDAVVAKLASVEDVVKKHFWKQQ